MAWEMIASIATSTEGVQTETVRMTEGFGSHFARQDLLRNHLQHFSQLQQTLRTSNEGDMARTHQSLRDQYPYEFRTELDSVRKELHMFQEANADNASEQ
eukprot:1652900-Amphidinium_carterae.1